MKPLKFFRLSAADKRLVLHALAVLLKVRFLLAFKDFETVRAFLGNRPAAVFPEKPSREKIVWALDAVRNALPGFRNCLVRALAAGYLLKEADYPSTLRIGVAKDASGRFEAHAWVESGAEVIVGRLKDLEKYTPLKNLEPGMRLRRPSSDDV